VSQKRKNNIRCFYKFYSLESLTNKEPRPTIYLYDYIKMDKQILDYEKKKNEMRNYLDDLNNKCGLLGMNFKYVAPSSNPMKYLDTDAYKKHVMKGEDEKKHLKSHCKLVNNPSKETDPGNRYYTKITNKNECNNANIRGVWDANQINRKDKFRNGVCWVNNISKTCGALNDKHFIRPYYSKFYDQSNKQKEYSERCNNEFGCKWEKQSQYTWDCVPGEQEEEVGPATNPPKELPIKEGLEDYINKWYTSPTGPLTTDLIGKGNRCINTTNTDQDVHIDNDKMQVKQFINFRLMDPNKKEYRNYVFTFFHNNLHRLFTMKELHEYIWNLGGRLDNKPKEQYMEIITNTVFEQYCDEFTQYRKKIELNPNAVFNKEKMFLFAFFDRIDELQFMEDVSIDNIKQQPKKGMFPSIPQSVVNMIMKHVAQNNGDKRGMLAWHSTGSGKTCTATGVIDAFWDTDRAIIFASSIDAIASNPDYKFHECAMNLYPRFQEGDFKGATKDESMALIGEAFKRRNIKFLSFAKLSNRVLNAQEYKKLHKIKKPSLTPTKTPKTPIATKPKSKSKSPKEKAAPVKKKIIKKKTGGRIASPKSHEQILQGEQYVDLDNAILIIDEVHNLFRPLANQKKEHERLEKELLDPKKHPNLKVVILTATPGDVLKLVNIIRNPKEPEIKQPDITNTEELKVFKEQIRGMISYFDMSNDTTKFPIVQDKQEFIKAPMSETQFSKYVDAYKQIKADQKNYDALAKQNKLSKFWEGPRKYANMLFNFDKDMSLSEFSAKMPYLLENIAKYPNEKQYVYSAFYTKMGYGGHGIVAVAKELEKKGYKKLTVQEAKRYNKVDKVPPKGKRYILAISTEIGEEGGNAGKNLHELIRIYNHPENKNGEIIHLMLASQGFNEGIDLKAVRHIHFFEPLVTMASDKQTLGRAARYCSHADLDRDKGEWTVQIHRYISDAPDLTAKINEKSEKKRKVNSDIIALQDQIKQIEFEEFEKEKVNEEIIAKLKEEIDKVDLILKAKDIELKSLGKATRYNIDKVEVVKGSIKELKTQKRELTNKIPNESKKKKEDSTITKIKNAIKDKEKELKALQTPVSKKVDKKEINNVEEFIFKESRERMKELLTVYQCMKEAAVDCKILSQFHSSTGHQVKCDF
jgi:muconolactone delta-isomerase